MPLIIRFWLLIAVLLVLSTAGADPDGRRLGHDEIKRMMENGEIVPLESILERFREQQPEGRLLEVELEYEHNRYVYELMILEEDGTVEELEYDAHTGKFWQRESDDH
ncbi:MAG: PepSY domain-containing protein [Gammaproteobacteria bacterium]|nr:PepSY domain-containing protein [Gammaproteobacteria bacterium]MCP5425507.1 PepSY domain-containing protein [Gammaproteobacteria bacterium]MCP5459373.1 PepSY domain-containing protein [Gammaproteobacteria bacterium]